MSEVKALLYTAEEDSYRNGKLIGGDVANVEEYWREDSVAFLSKLDNPDHCNISDHQSDVPSLLSELLRMLV